MTPFDEDVPLAPFEPQLAAQARQFLLEKPANRVNLDRWTSGGGANTDCCTIACGVGWLIRDQRFHVPGYRLSEHGSVVSDETRTVWEVIDNKQLVCGYLYAANLLGLSYEQARMIFTATGSSRLDAEFSASKGNLGEKPSINDVDYEDWADCEWRFLMANQKELLLYRFDRVIESIEQVPA